ncbi:MAG TPA: radical SAM protein [Candidatus Sulfotelmatobacter sp.]|nr:radical SAM protein [Candidatus Sulfotelmatobacter sp.]
MSNLVSISARDHSAVSHEADLSRHLIHTLPVVVIAAHNQCSCRCVMCDIWKIRDPQEIRPQDLERQVQSFRDLGVRWAVFTGGEPQRNANLFTLAEMLRREGIRITLLTAGLLLEAQAEQIAATIDDVIVSLDGPPPVHNLIRRVPRAFERIATGVQALRRYRPDIVVGARCTVQKQNHRHLCALITAAKDTDLTSVSFLAADVVSSAFNRPDVWPEERQQEIALNSEEVEELAGEIERMISEYRHEIDSGFVVENPAKLRRLVSYFRAHLFQEEHVAPYCNAPWVSAVIDSSGDVRPCFFHPPLGNIHANTVAEIVNGAAALQFRAHLDIPTNSICRSCVCSLHINQ